MTSIQVIEFSYDGKKGLEGVNQKLSNKSFYYSYPMEDFPITCYGHEASEF